jgi:hypothetical protein
MPFKVKDDFVVKICPRMRFSREDAYKRDVVQMQEFLKDIVMNAHNQEIMEKANHYLDVLNNKYVAHPKYSMREDLFCWEVIHWMDNLSESDFDDTHAEVVELDPTTKVGSLHMIESASQPEYWLLSDWHGDLRLFTHHVMCYAIQTWHL